MKNQSLVVWALAAGPLGACGSSSGSSSSSGSGSSGGGSAASGGSSSSGGGSQDGGCSQIAGIYALGASSSCTGGFTAPAAVCVSQTGCNVTMAGTSGTLTGTISGNSFSVTDPNLQETCTGTVDGSGNATVSCSAVNGAVTCSLTASPLGTPPAGYQATCCDLALQNCGAGATCRPGLVTTPAGSGNLNLCYTATGSVALGQPCTRSAASISQDDCAAPLVCTLDGVAAGSFQCAALCTQASDCPSGQDCLGFTDPQAAGVCIATCDLFASPSNCPSGVSCNLESVAAAASLGGAPVDEFCNGTGTEDAGAACTLNVQCGPGLGCSSPGMTCEPYCDATHACADGGTCKVSAPKPAGDATLGLCQ